MAIRDVVTRGFGNGTYDPGVNDLPTRGYTIGAAIADIVGGQTAALELYHLGVKSLELYDLGSKNLEVYPPGVKHLELLN